jgi:diguanylate cyclase (GGDEF)-like protein
MVASGAEALEPLGILKRRLYLLVWPFGVAAVLLALGVKSGNGSLTRIEFLVYPLVVLYLIAMPVMVLWWKGDSALRMIERSMFAMCTVILFLLFCDALFWRPAAERTDALGGLLYWFPVAYVVAYVGFDKRAPLASGGFFLLTLLAALVFLPQAFAAKRHGEIYALAHFFLANAIYIVLLYAVTVLRVHYSSAQSRAETMSRLALTDTVTNLPNRRHLELLLARETERARRFTRPFSVILLDLDGFKQVNDSHGHEAGDEVLRQVGLALKEHLRPSDEVGRWGGDEFLVLAPELNIEKARQMAERLRAMVGQEPMEGMENVTASFGVASYATQDSVEVLLRRADEALYRAKSGGRNRVEGSET